MQGDYFRPSRTAEDHDRLVRLEGVVTETRSDVAEIKALIEAQAELLTDVRVWRAEQRGQLKGAATVGGIIGGLLTFLAGIVAKAMGWV